MNEIKQNRIERFLNDEVMSEAVHDVLLSVFLKERQHMDVNLLAASRLAINFLNQAWKELEKLKVEKEDSSPILKQVGL